MNAWRLDRARDDVSVVVADAIAAMGRPGFGDAAMSGLRRYLGVGSWSVYRLWVDRPPVMYLSGSDGGRDATPECFSTYRDRSLYQRDSSFRPAWEAGGERGPVMLQMAADEAPSPEHRDTIYLRHGMLERLSVARQADDGSLLAVNVYRHARDACPSPTLTERFGLLAPALIATVTRHLEMAGSAPPTPVQAVRAALSARCAQLTGRELDVLVLLLEGRTYDGVASELRLSVSTVQTYRARAYERLGIHFRSQLFGIVRGAGRLTS